MPHQCLNCGKAFAEGSTDLLKGCPTCEGTRFFYTDEPVGEEERQELKEEKDESVHEMLEDLLEKGEKRNLSEEIWSREAWERWIKVEQGDGGVDVKELTEDEAVLEATGDLDDPDTELTVQDVEPEAPAKTTQVSLEDVEEVDPPGDEPAEEAPSPPTLEPGDEATSQVVQAPEQEQGQPSTLNISEPGNYEIDVERLMDGNPVIVERDGSYVIHLPSVFGKGDKRR